jgi:hypothetical protein
VRISAFPPWLVTWIHARAAATVELDGVKVPSLSYQEIADRLKKARKIDLSRHQVLRLIRGRFLALHVWRSRNRP